MRASKAADLRWDQVDFGTATLHVRRVKQGSPSTHPILGDELRSLRRLQREQEPKSPFVFTSERGSPFTTAGFARMVKRAGTEANFGFKVHPHMLRHACGFALASKGHDTRALQAYLGHRNIQHTCDTSSVAGTVQGILAGLTAHDLTNSRCLARLRVSYSIFQRGTVVGLFSAGRFCRRSVYNRPELFKLLFRSGHQFITADIIEPFGHWAVSTHRF